MAEVIAASDDTRDGSSNHQLRWVAPVAIALLMIVLAATTGPRVFAAALWGDELRTWRDGIEKPLSDVLMWRHNADHAPLGHLLARGGATLFGVEHAWGLRLGSWLCGLACVPALWWMGRTFWDGAVGVAMAVMAVVDPNLASQMVLARMYAPLLLIVIVSLTIAGSILMRPGPPWRRAALLGVTLGLGIWTHAQIYAVVIALLLIALAMLVRNSTRRVAASLFLAIAIGGAIGAPGIAKILHRHDADTIVTADVTDAPGGQLEDAVHKLTGKAWLTYAILATVVGGHAILVANRPTHRWLSAMLATLVVVAVVNVLVAARYRPVAHARYLTVIQPALWFGIALVVVDVFRTHRRGAPTFAWATLATWIALCVFEARRIEESLRPHPLAQPFAEAAREIRKSIAKGDRFTVIARSPYGMYTRYYGLAIDQAIDDALSPSSSSRLARTKINAAKLDRGVIWLLCVVPPPNIKYRYPLDDPQRVVEAVAGSRGTTINPLPELDKTDAWHAAVIRVDGDGIELRGLYPAAK